jgi:hypothetical protein
LEREQTTPRPQPPERASPFDQFKNQDEQRVAEHRREHETFYAVQQPDPGRGGIEAEAFLEAELRIPFNGQTGQREHKSHGEKKGRHRPRGNAERTGQKMKRPRQHGKMQGAGVI